MLPLIYDIGSSIPVGYKDKEISFTLFKDLEYLNLHAMIETLVKS